MATKYRVKVVLRTGDRELAGPAYESEERAQKELEAVKDAQQSGRWVELEWLSVNGGEVLVASIERRGATAASF